MNIAELEVSLETRFRDESGRFIEEVREGASESAEELADTIAARAIVNVASRLRVRSGQLLGGIDSRMVSAFVGEAFVAGVKHAAPQEEGAGPHPIPNAFGWGITVDHPGNPAVHYMRDAGRGMAAIGMAIIRKNMPSG